MKALIKLFVCERKRKICCVTTAVIYYSDRLGGIEGGKRIWSSSENMLPVVAYIYIYTHTYLHMYICVIKFGCCLPQELQKGSCNRKGDQGVSEKTSLESIQSSVPLFLQYPVPYTQDAPTPLLVSQSPSRLQFGNPYSASDAKGWFSIQLVLKL